MKTIVWAFFPQGNNLRPRINKIHNVTTTHSIGELCSLSKWKPVFTTTAALVALLDFHFRGKRGWDHPCSSAKCKLTRLAGDTCPYSQIRHTCYTRSETKCQWKGAMGTTHNTTADIPSLHTCWQKHRPAHSFQFLKSLYIFIYIYIFISTTFDGKEPFWRFQKPPTSKYMEAHSCQEKNRYQENVSILQLWHSKLKLYI